MASWTQEIASTDYPPAAMQRERPGRAAPPPDLAQRQATMPVAVRGSVDVVTTTEVRGWAYAPGRRETVRVQALLNHEILGEAAADTHRPDLAAAGLGDGNAGYAIRLFRAIDPTYLPFVAVKVDGGDIELPRAPLLGFGEFFTALYSAHPAAGRSRSVFGGLWTDRTDAAALLRGKTAIGQIDPATAAALGPLIHDGFAIVALEAAPNEAAWRQSLTDRIAELLEQPPMRSVLRAVLEDNPLAVQAAWLAERATDLAQPSVANPSPSPAECLDVVVAFGDAVALDVVRASHMLPEFTPAGVSRWASRSARDGVGLAAMHGMVDRVMLHAGKAAVFGPGTLYRVRHEAGTAAVRLLCLPARGAPVSLLALAGSQDRSLPGDSPIGEWSVVLNAACF